MSLVSDVCSIHCCWRDKANIHVIHHLVHIIIRLFFSPLLTTGAWRRRLCAESLGGKEFAALALYVNYQMESCMSLMSHDSVFFRTNVENRGQEHVLNLNRGIILNGGIKIWDDTVDTILDI